MKGDRRVPNGHAPQPPMTIAKLVQAIRRLPADVPVEQVGVWYRTQKEHWLGWLSEYHGPGACNRSTRIRRDAKFAYNHIVEPKMLLWLVSAAGINRARLKAARAAAGKMEGMAAKSGAIRGAVPWHVVEGALRSRPRKTRVGLAPHHASHLVRHVVHR